MREKHSYVKNKTSSQCYLKKGDVVLIKENDSTPRLSWKKEVIKKLIIGNDKKSEAHQFEQHTGNQQKQ